MKHPLLLFVFLPAICCFSLSSPIQGAESPSERTKSLQKELERVRTSLHEAQRELAVKAERISALERKIESGESKIGTNSPVEGTPEKRENASAKGSSERSAKEKETSARKNEVPVSPKTAAPKVAPKVAPKTAVKPYLVTYEKNSAVNYEGRKGALKWIKKQLEENKKRIFTISATANDTRYADTNREIAKNRGRYLADFLIANGIPKESLESIRSDASTEDGVTGRQCLISFSKE